MTDTIILAQAQIEAKPVITEAKPETAEAIIEDVSAGITPVLNYLSEAAASLGHQFFSEEGLFQIGVILIAGLAAWFLTNPAGKLAGRIWRRGEIEVDAETTGDGEERPKSSAFAVFQRLVFPIIWVLGLWIGVKVFRGIGTGNDLMRILASLLNAWILIRLFSTFVRDPLWSKAFATVAWVIAALNILRLLNPTIAFLDSIAMRVGEGRMSAYMVIKGMILLIVLLWAASLVTRFVQSRISKSRDLTPSVQTLIAQAVRIFLLFAAIMLAMNAIGVDLTALAVFSGAIGVGIGFGLQAIFSNLVAGIILLLERSIKVGDFVELESGLTGEVREINIRSTLITTNDNVDILVPNAEFINNRVTNWTLRESYRRTRIPFGVAYGTDKELVRTAAIEAADSLPHMLKGRNAKPAQVWLVGFGDSSLDFELVVWLSPEAVKRPSSVAADYNWALETALGKYGIEIPFPQRDLHIRSGELPIKLTEQITTKNGASSI